MSHKFIQRNHIDVVTRPLVYSLTRHQRDAPQIWKEICATAANRLAIAERELFADMTVEKTVKMFTSHFGEALIAPRIVDCLHDLEAAGVVTEEIYNFYFGDLNPLMVGCKLSNYAEFRVGKMYPTEANTILALGKMAAATVEQNSAYYFDFELATSKHWVENLEFFVAKNQENLESVVAENRRMYDDSDELADL